MFSWDVYVKRLSYVYITISVLKYFTQVVYNVQRQSTAGYSTAAIYCDLAGGLLSYAPCHFFDTGNESPV